MWSPDKGGLTVALRVILAGNVKAAQTKLIPQFFIFSMREGDQYSIFNIWAEGGGTSILYSRLSAERLLQKGHLFASGDAKSSNTGCHIKESGHCLASSSSG